MTAPPTAGDEGLGGGASNATTCGLYVTNDVINVTDYAEFYKTSQFITGLVLYPLIITVGLTGNILTLVVLSRRLMLTSTNTFLGALAAADTIKLLNDILYVLVTILFHRHPLAGNRMLGYMYPFSHYIFNQSVCVSAWLTVSVAVERYISVCHATRAKVVCTVRRARIVSAVVFVVMSLVAVPCAFIYTRVEVYDSTLNRTMFKINRTAFGLSKDLKIYRWIQNLLRSIIPLCVLIVLNTLIIQSLRRERIKGKRMSSRNRITLMLIVVILVFIVCVFPDAIMSTVFGFGYVDESNLVKGIREFTDFLLSLNSAVNFMIYCLCSKGFREIFCDILCRRPKDRQKQSYAKVNSFSCSTRVPDHRVINEQRELSANPDAICFTEYQTPNGRHCPDVVPKVRHVDKNREQEVEEYTGPETAL